MVYIIKMNKIPLHIYKTSSYEKFIIDFNHCFFMFSYHCNNTIGNKQLSLHNYSLPLSILCQSMPQRIGTIKNGKYILLYLTNEPTLVVI